MLDRREFVGMAAGSVVAMVGGSAVIGQRKIKAIAFDAFPIFDPRPVFALAEQLFPERGAELSDEWKTRQFEYTWLRTLTGQYQDFWGVTRDALVYATQKLGLSLDEGKSTRLMNAYLSLKSWPDVAPVLRSLKESGIRLGILSNFTEKMQRSCIESAGLDGFFEQILSTDRVAAFKPDRRAYQIGLDAFGLRRDEIVFAAFAGWDAVGAKAFGYPTFWVNRAGTPEERFGTQPDAIGANLKDLQNFLGTLS